MRLQRFLVESLYIGLLAAGGLFVFRTGPDIEARIFPVLTNVYLVPPDLSKPNALSERFPDRVCWKQHIHKSRLAVAVWWSIAVVLPDESRVLDGPLDHRTGEPFTSLNNYSSGFDGTTAWCAKLPSDLDPHLPLRIESQSWYDTGHGLWLVPQKGPVVDVPGIGDAP